jgi:ketosteroid isomerase-like protein
MKRATLLLVLMGIASGCGGPSFDAAAEARALLARDAEWATTASEGKDVEKTISYWSDDAVVIPPGQPIVEGKSALRSFVTDSFKMPGFKVHWVSRDVKFSPDGKLAYMRSDNEMTVPRADGTPMKMSGRAVTVWRRDPDGQWRCVVDTWNDPPAAAPTLSAK